MMDWDSRLRRRLWHIGSVRLDEKEKKLSQMQTDPGEEKLGGVEKGITYRRKGKRGDDAWPSWAAGQGDENEEADDDRNYVKVSSLAEEECSATSGIDKTMHAYLYLSPILSLQDPSVFIIPTPSLPLTCAFLSQQTLLTNPLLAPDLFYIYKKVSEHAAQT